MWLGGAELEIRFVDKQFKVDCTYMFASIEAADFSRSQDDV